jgi:hypothetical protein
MSASNWAICPRCVERAKDALTDQTIEIGRMYGRVTIEEFDAARKAQKPVNPEDFRTFREDYSFHGAEEGAVVASYGGECSECGLSVDFEHVHKFWPAT